jgi:DMSO/TMAO reductase YedYZ molybdopterin-dependent catalytic subunit
MRVVDRREFLSGTAGAALAGALPGLARAQGLSLSAGLPDGLRSSAVMESLPGKKPLIKLSYRPPNYESPIEYFRTAITPNDEFFVRYHLSVIPEIDPKTWKLSVGGEGADGPPVDKTPDFVKSIPVWKAIEDTTLIAYEMNGVPLPHLNGAPARIILPGWTGTYWMKHIVSIKAVMAPEKNFWMAAAYRVPLGKFPMVARFTTQESAVNTPITEMVVNSLITSHPDGAKVEAGATLGGIAWDGGYGIRAVEVSLDGGKSWQAAKLGDDLGKFAFRTWSFPLSAKGKVTAMARASNAIGQTQTASLILNPAGYHHNVIHSVTLNVA